MPVKVRLLSATAGLDEDAREYTLRYWVSLESKEQGPLTAILATGWERGMTYRLSDLESDSGSICVGIDANPVDEGNFIDYEIEVRFGQPSTDTASNPDNPLAAPVDEQWGYTSAELPIAVDLTGKVLANTAGCLFERSFRGNIPTMTFTRNEPTLNRSLWISCRNSVNLTPWKGFDAKTVKVSNISAQSQYGPNGKYYRVTYSFDTNPETWRFRPLNAGRVQITENATGVKTRQKVYVSGTEEAIDVPLDANGKSLRNPNTGKLTGTPFLLDFQIYPEVEFASLFPFL